MKRKGKWKASVSSLAHTRTHTRASSDVSNLGKNLVNLPATVSSLLFFSPFFRLFLNLLVVSLPFNIFSCYRLFGFGSSSLAISFSFLFLFIALYRYRTLLSSPPYSFLFLLRPIGGKTKECQGKIHPFVQLIVPF